MGNDSITFRFLGTLAFFVIAMVYSISRV